MKQFLSLAAILLILSGCASKEVVEVEDLSCGTVSSYLELDPAKDLYRVVVLHLDDDPVISQPNYQLSVGEHTFLLSELIDSPDLNVKLAARTPKTITVKVEANKRYHIAAKLNKSELSAKDNRFWEPVIWFQDEAECELPKTN